MKQFTLNSWGRDYPVYFTKDNYTDGNKLYVGLLTDADGFLEPYADVTVNVEDFTPKNENCALIDTNNLGNDIVFWLQKNGLGHSTARWGYSGFCSYPEFEFNMDVLNDVLFNKNEYTPSEEVDDEEEYDDDDTYYEPKDVDYEVGYDPYTGSFSDDL